MKLRSPWMIHCAAWVGARLARGLMSTVRMKWTSFGQHTDPWDPQTTERFIYLFWHENLISLGKFYSTLPVALLTSKSSDGELAARLVEQVGVVTVRGSSSSGGMEALTELIDVSKRCHITIAPDGPRGPRREVKRGIPYLSAWTGLRIVPLGIAYHRAWRAGSWDKTVIPRPFTRMTLVGGPVIAVPPTLGKRDMEAYRQHIQWSMNTATDLAEHWVAGRIAQPVWPTVPQSAAA